MMRLRAVLTAGLLSLAVAACGTGNGTVYVGVGVAGPWGAYPYPYPGVPGPVIGYPPRYWDDDREDADAPPAQPEDPSIVDSRGDERLH